MERMLRSATGAGDVTWFEREHTDGAKLRVPGCEQHRQILEGLLFQEIDTPVCICCAGGEAMTDVTCCSCMVNHRKCWRHGPTGRALQEREKGGEPWNPWPNRVAGPDSVTQRQFDKRLRELLTEAHAAGVEVAGWLSEGLTAVAATVPNGAGGLLRQRPGSWEADSVRSLILDFDEED